jgi:hypothetical protein
MARRRVIDWKKASRSLKRKPWVEKLTWFGILGSVDDFGLCYWSPVQVGQMFMEEELNGRRVSVKSIEACMETFATGRDPRIVTWTVDGQRFLAVRKHQDYQRVRLPSNADCPCPPGSVLQKLSEPTRILIADNLQKFTSFTDDGFAPEAEEEAEQEGEAEVNTASARERAKPTKRVKRASNPQSSGADANQAAIDYFFGRLQRHTGLERPVFSGGQAARFFSSRLKAGDTLDDFTETIDEFFDRRIRGEHSAANFSLYQRAYNALCIAVQKRRRGRGE